MDNSLNAADPIYASWEVEDPLGHDRPDDVVVITTRRALCRLAFVAAETAYRFERERVDHDAMAWMMAPRTLFEGLAPIDACLDRKGFQRAIVLHGLSIGLDARPEQIEALIDDGDDDEDESWLDDGLLVGGLSGCGIRVAGSHDDHHEIDVVPRCRRRPPTPIDAWTRSTSVSAGRFHA